MKGESVELVPMMKEHFSDLIDLAKDKRIWEFIPINMSNEQKCSEAFYKALVERDQGTQFLL